MHDPSCIISLTSKESDIIVNTSPSSDQRSLRKDVAFSKIAPYVELGEAVYVQLSGHAV